MPLRQRLWSLFALRHALCQTTVVPVRQNLRKSDGQQPLVRALEQVAGGDQSALRFLFDNTSAKLKSICVRILKNDTEAEDVLQEVYVTVWRRAASFDPARGGADSWLTTIARNSAIDRLRSLRSRGEHASLDAAVDVQSDDPDAYAQAVTKREDARVHHCLATLETRSREAIRVAFFEGLSYPELATRAGMPLGTVKSLIRRGMQRLRECLSHD